MRVRNPAFVALSWVAAVSVAMAQENPLREAARLDNEQKCGDSERIYERLLGEGTPSAVLMNNLGNHYLICGNGEKARFYFERLRKLNPRHPNANLQLARMAVEAHQGAQALTYLSVLNENGPAQSLLRAEALHWAGRHEAALAALDDFSKMAQGNPDLAYFYGVTCARIGAFDRAVKAFNAALSARPNDYEILLNLGRAAARAKSFKRALEVLDVAQRLQPENVEGLLELASVSSAVGDHARAVYLLVQAEKLAPERLEITLALAHAAQAGAYYGDAALAYDKYLKSKPADAAARRDWALSCVLTGKRESEGMDALRTYVKTHSADPIGHYYLAQAMWSNQPEAAVEALQSAVRLDPKFAPAHIDLGWLLNRQGRIAEAIPQLERAAELLPDNARALDQLGAVYLTAGRTADSVKTLRKAAALAPQDSGITMHLGRALIEGGQSEQGRQLLDRIRNAHPARARGPWREPGMIESASLSPAERDLREVERLCTQTGLHPDDPELQFRLGSLLLASGRTDEAEREFRTLLVRNSDREIWPKGGKFLLAFERYALAKEFLERAAETDGNVRLDLATAVAFCDGAGPALKMLDDIPAQEKNGDYYLLKAKILDGTGEHEEAVKTGERALHLSFSNSRIAQEAVSLFVREGHIDSALSFLQQSAAGDPELLLLRAALLADRGKSADAAKILREIESQWPEWDRPYVVHGLLLENSAAAEARKKFETAVALGSQDPFAVCGLDRLRAARAKEQNCSCAGNIRQLLVPGCPKS